MPADTESNTNVIEDSLDHLPEKLLERDPVTMFDENKKVQVFDQNGVEYAENYAKNFKIVT